VETVALPDGRTFVVARDEFGNPLIRARSLDEGLIGWGYACASDRYFQLAWMRHILRGTLASLIGDRPLGDLAPSAALRGARVSDLDLLARALDLVGVARRSLEACSPPARDAAARYALGINVWLERHGLPLECRLLGERAAPWLAEDCALMAKGVGLMLTFSWRAALAGLHARGRPHALPLRSFPAVPATTPPEDVAALIDAVRATLGAGPGPAASNAVAVAPRRARTGAPLLAADPHMPLGTPCVFWEMALWTPELRAQGATVPGAPLVSMGQNAHVAWGITAGWGDDSQLYLEPPSEIAAARTRHVVIPRRGESPRRATVRTTPRGPVISDALPGVRGPGTSGVSLAWVGLETTRELDAALGVLTARSADDLRAALAWHACPTANVVFADVQGELGFQYAGWIPRRSCDGLACADALDPQARWQGWRTTVELPGCDTPPSGIIVSTNTQPDGHADFTPLVEPPFRFHRWHQLLRSAPVLGAEDLAAFQRDVTSAWAREVGRMIAPHLDVTLRRRLLEWDGHAHRGSSTAALVYATLRELAREVGADDPALAATYELVNAPVLPLTRAIARRLAERDGSVVARRALARAERTLRDELGEPSAWRWGALHRATFPHPLSKSLLRWIFRVDEVSLGGDGTTIAMTAHNLARGFDVEIGPSLRLVMDVAQPARSRGVLVPGASGHVRSRHYADQVELWAEGKLRAMGAARWE
jgi:penicillin amidase